jgi:hypothetical protein
MVRNSRSNIVHSADAALNEVARRICGNANRLSRKL